MLIMLEHLGQYNAFAAITLHNDLMQMLIALKCWMLIKSFVNENKNESWIGYF